MKTEWNTDHRQALRQAFDADWPGPVGEAIFLQNAHLRLQVYPQDGARITSLQAFGVEVLRQWTPQRKAFQYGCFPMVPWAGRLGDATLLVGEQRYALPANKPPHALHGMACYSSWEVVSQSADSLTLRMPLGDPWPWAGEVRQTLTLEEDAITLRLEIHTASAAFPASAGWHPWFVKSPAPQNAESALQVTFVADWQEEPGEDELPTGRRIAPQPGPWDDCFGFADGLEATLEWPGRLVMTMTSDARQLVVFDKQPDATCVNPLTQAPNAINRTPQFVTVDSPLTIVSRWQFRRPE